MALTASRRNGSTRAATLTAGPVRRHPLSFGVALAVLVALWLTVVAAPARAAVFSNTSSIALNDPDSQTHFLNGQQVQNATATPFPSTVSVSGLTGTISSMSLTLSNVSYSFSNDIDVLLVGPGGQTLIPIAAIGPNTGGGEAASNSTLTVSDSGTLPSATTPWGSSPSFKPVNYGQVPNGTVSGENGFNEYWWPPAPAPPYGDPGQTGTATFASQFGGTNPNGTWSLYVITTSGGDGTGAIGGGWSLNITTASAASTSTVLSSDNNPSFTSAPGDSVTLTAAVSSTSTVSEGTVDFTDGGTTISGCGAVAVSSGQAQCTTSFSTEGDHALEAQYGGTGNFGPSNGTVTQQVNDHTTITGSSYCNTGAVTLNNPATTQADASPYPSRVFVSGLSGALSHLTVTLNNATYGESQDIDALLVGPAGQSFILAADAGPNSSGAISNVTLTLDDAAGTTLPQGSVWGAPHASVTSKPFNYGGFNETWGPPAPAGPYGNPGPSGGGTGTLGSTFNGTNPDGTWSLYLITTAAGDGTGSLAAGWCADITTANVASTSTAVSSNDNPSFTTSPGNSVTLTAAVTSTSTVNEGTVDFTDGGTTIAGCGAVAVSSGQAECTTSFSTEGVHAIEALYSGTVNFGASHASLSQQVDDHTTVTGSTYCNTGAVALDNPPLTETGASPYPSHVFMSGLPGNLLNLTVSLKNVTYGESQDIDALLVGPGGQSLILVAAAGPNSGGAISNVTLTLDDAAAPTLASNAAWGAPNSSVASKPVNFGGLNELWGPPAPAGPYGNPGPSGGGTATLGSTFDGTSPNGTWSLYLITTAAGDGTGAVAGGWCLDETIQPAPLSINTNVSATPIGVGSPSSDTATLAGAPSGANAPTGTVTFNAYGPDDATCSNAPAFTSTNSLTGAGTSITSGNFTPTSTGTYLWTATYSGDLNYLPESTACGDAGETVVVNPAAPSIATTASAGITLGGTISDSAALSDGFNPTGTITFDVYGPGDPTCASTPAFTSTVPVTAGNGAYGSGDFTPTAAGTYQFIASYSGDGNNAVVSTACGDPNESVTVTQASPTILTQASPSVTVGGQVMDSATLSGGASPTGTITFKLFGPGDATCTGTPAFTSTDTVSAGNGDYTSVPFTTAAVGAYNWTASYSGDANNAAVSTACGDPNESVTVTQASPTIVTHASGTVAVGGNVTDTATLSVGASPTGTITFNLYGPGDATCTGTPAFTSTKTVSSGNGAYTSVPFTTAAVGTYNWTASYNGDANNRTVTTACGDPNETVVVTAGSPTIVTLASGTVVVGGSVRDTATLGGGVAPTGTITFNLYGPGDATCAGTPAFTSTKTVSSGNGAYTSDPFTTAEAGIYNWTASYSGDTNNAATASSCGASGESVAVGQASTSTTLVSSLNPSATGQAVTFTAMLTGTAPTGTVTFIDGSSTLGAGMLGSSGAASFTTSSLSAGSHTITAVYGGDANNLRSTSSVLTQVVSNPAAGAPTVSITRPRSGASYRFGQHVHASYSCSDGAGGPGIVSCAGPVPSGSRINTRRAGTHTFAVTAVSGDGQTATATVVYRVRRPSNHFTISRIRTHAGGTVTFNLKLPGPGIVYVLETAWKDNIASTASPLGFSSSRFAFARKRIVVHRSGTIHVSVKPGKPGLELIVHHSYPALVRLWVSYTPTGGLQRNKGWFGLHFPG